MRERHYSDVIERARDWHDALRENARKLQCQPPLGAPGSIARHLDDKARAAEGFGARYACMAYRHNGTIVVRAVGTKESCEHYAQELDGDSSRHVVDVTWYGCLARSDMEP